jgi:hypothetical protein
METILLLAHTETGSTLEFKLQLVRYLSRLPQQQAKA